MTSGSRPDGGLLRLLAAAPGDARVAVERLIAFEAMVKRWNRYGGLVSKRDVGRLRTRHIEESLALLPWWRGRLADVGTGAGLPGVPLAIARPAAPVVLIERSERKGRFLRQVLIDLALDNVTLVVADAASYRPERRFDTVVARALAPPPTAWRLVRPLLATGALALFQSRAPLDSEAFEAGRIVECAQAGAAHWVTAVAAAA